ncbi:putative inner-membrane translocator [Komagataeibacter xylinus E25]|nr:putative inner-membrane translocator [Komagataeibacter xylinus E25]
MSRFVTLFFAVVAAVSGLFLYNKKQQTTALDHQIAQIVEQTEHVRSQTAMLRAEWAMLNQPDRLGTLASRYDRGLQPVTPTQFVQMSALAAHLPAPGSPSPHPAPAPRATMVATLAADHVVIPPVHDAAPAPHVAPAMPAAAPVVAHADHVAAAPRHADPAPHDALARALAQNDARPAPRAPAVEHVHAPERPVAVASAEPARAPVVHDTIVPPARMGASYHARSPNIAEAAWHPAAVHMGGSSLGTPHVSALPPPVPVSN